MEKAFQGRGFRFPLLPDATGQLGYTKESENIEQSLRILLLTARGERVMRPDFGSKAPALVFAPASRQFLRLLETSIREAIRDYEPRVELLRARAEPDPGESARVTVSIEYRERRSNTRQNLVFPFYLDHVGVTP